MSSFGLTGGIASGKSTVAGMFAALGARIIDADKIGHEQLLPGASTFDEIVSRFGGGILNAGGEIDRNLLGDVVFADPEKRAALNAIVHPAIMARRRELTRLYQDEDPAAVVISDAALIYEAHIESWFLKIIVAWCKPEEQFARLMAKTGLARQAAERRIAAQMNTDEKRRRADYVIDTSGAPHETRKQVEALYPQLKRLAEVEARSPVPAGKSTAREPSEETPQARG
jgi:dephospho-CoA kinase